MTAETEFQRDRRRYQRTLFDGVADLYDASRLTYPTEMVDFVVTTAGLDADSAVLEVGCGTGQLTEQLAGFDFALTAIDIGPSMVAAARRRVGDHGVSYQVTAFEDLVAPDHSFDLIVSGSAYHWIDPDVKYQVPARLLRSGGWLAVLGTQERYDDPFGAALERLWHAHINDAWPWRPPPADAVGIKATGLFEPPISRTHSQRTVTTPDVLVDVENTRATSLSWPDDVRLAFTAELRDLLSSETEVPMSQDTTLTMARVLG